MVERKPKSNYTVVGTDWEQILKEIDRSFVPVDLIREIHFLQDGESFLSIDMKDLDDDAVDLLSTLISQMEHLSDNQVRLIVDLGRYERLITSIVSPMLRSLPSKN